MAAGGGCVDAYMAVAVAAADRPPWPCPLPRRSVLFRCGMSSPILRGSLGLGIGGVDVGGSPATAGAAAPVADCSRSKVGPQRYCKHDKAHG